MEMQDKNASETPGKQAQSVSKTRKTSSKCNYFKKYDDRMKLKLYFCRQINNQNKNITS